MWRTGIQAAAATFTEDAGAADRAFKSYRGRIFPRLLRTPGGVANLAAPSLAAGLEARATVCRIAQVHGVDLWNVSARSGDTIASAIDSLVSSLGDPKRWTKDQLADFQSDGVVLLAFAAIGLNRPDYVAQFRKWERGDSGWLAVADLLVGRWEAAGHQTRH